MDQVRRALTGDEECSHHHRLRVPVNPAIQRAMRNPLPQGAIAIGVGLVLAGLTQYGFLSISAHALGTVRYAPLAKFWAALFVCGPGFFLPLEQELGRALAARRTRGQGGRPLVARAAVAGLGMAACLMLAAGIASGPLGAWLFGGDTVLVWALIAGLLAFCVQFLVRGTLAGNARFRPYGVLIGSEGVVRVMLCVALGVAGATAAGVYGLALVVGSFLAVAIALAGRRGLLLPGPRAAWSELSSALGYLLVASVLTQFLLSVGTLAVGLLATHAQQAAAGRFLNSRIVAYVPIFMFQAVQYALLPKLSALAARGHHNEFRKVLVKLLLFAAGLGAVATAGLAVLGPLVTRLLFGGGFELGHLDFALLGASGTVFMVAQVLSQALISLTRYARVAVGWIAGAAAFVLVTALGSQLFLRVELGLLAGSVATVALMAAMLIPLLRTRAVVIIDAEALVAAVPPVAET